MGEKKKVVYILGPFEYKRGLDDYEAVEDMLTDMGYETISPVLIPEGLDKAKHNRIAVAMIDSADAVVVLPDWRTSQTAVAEHHLALCFDKPLVEVKEKDHDPYGDGMNPPEIMSAWLRHDLGRALGEVSA